MKFLDFNKQLNKENISSGYLIQGEDWYFKMQARDRIKNTLDIQNIELNLSVFEDKQTQEFLNSLDMFPMMTDKRLSIISIDKIDDKFVEKLTAYMENPNPDSVFIIMNKGADIKGIPNVDTIECNFESMAVLSKWVRVKLRSNGIDIDDFTASNMVERCTFDMVKISGATDMLVCYLNGRTQVTMDDIEDVIPFELEIQVFDLINSIVAKNAQKALKIIAKMQANRAEDTKIIAMLYGSYRRMFFASISNLNDMELSKKLNVKPFAIKKSRETARKYSPARLRKCLLDLVGAEADIKTGKAPANGMLVTTVLKMLNN